MKIMFALTRLAAIALLAFPALGCQEKVYQIEQWARGDKLWRRLTVSRDEQGNGQQEDLSEPTAEIAPIANLYGSEAPKIKGRRASFVGAVAGGLTHDVGGDGHYVHWESPLGNVSARSSTSRQ